MDVQEGLRHHDKATTGLACVCCNHGFERGRVVNRRCNRLYFEGRSGCFEGVQVKLRRSTMIVIALEAPGYRK